jgi:hypothetical protein
LGDVVIEEGEKVSAVATDSCVGCRIDFGLITSEEEGSSTLLAGQCFGPDINFGLVCSA